MIGQKYNALLKRIQLLHAYVVKHPGCTQQQMCEHFGLGEHSVRKYLGILRDTEHVRKHDGSRQQRGSMPATYHATSKAVPTTVLPPGQRNAKKPQDPSVRQFIVRAPQLGNVRAYADLPREFFGQAVRA